MRMKIQQESAMTNISGRTDAKKPVNLSLSAHNIEKAKLMGMNLSKEVDQWLSAELEKRYWERWNEENADAIRAYNQRIATEGLPLEKYRTF
jgi:antitoxin CcdA